MKKFVVCLMLALSGLMFAEGSMKITDKLVFTAQHSGKAITVSPKNTINLYTKLVMDVISYSKGKMASTDLEDIGMSSMLTVDQEGARAYVTRKVTKKGKSVTILYSTAFTVDGTTYTNPESLYVLMDHGKILINDIADYKMQVVKELYPNLY